MDGAETVWATGLGDPQPLTAQTDDDEGLTEPEPEESVFTVMAHQYDFRQTTVAQRPRQFGTPSRKKLRRRLAWLLRFGAPKVGIPMRDDGYVKISDLKASGYFPANFHYGRAVYGDDKKRFSHEVENGVGLIRANSGHGISGVKVVHRYFNRATAPAMVVHITDEDGCEGILKEGIKRKRNEISFWRRAPAPAEVNSVTYVVYVDVPRALDDGLLFGETSDGVVVSRGDLTGTVDVKYIVKVVELPSNRQIFPKDDAGSTIKDGAGPGFVQSHGAYDTEFAFFVWGKFQPHGLDIMMLVDTGASISVLPSDFYNSIPEEFRPTLQPVKIVIEVGNGGRLQHDGVCRLKFDLGDFTFDHEFFVCKDSTHAILGNEFLVHYGIVIRMAEGWLEYRGNDIPLFNRHGVQKTARVFVAHHITIPPRTEAEVPTYIRRHDSPRQPQLFEPNGMLWSDVMVVAPRMIFDPRDEHPRVRLYNPSDRSITVGVSRCLGTLTPAEDIVAPCQRPVATTTGAARSTVRPGGDRRSLCVHQTTDTATPVSVTELSAADVEAKYDAATIPEHIKDLVAKATTSMAASEVMRVTLLLVEYADVFASHDADIGRTTLIEHDVDTGDARPVAQAVRRQSPDEHKAMVDIVETLYRCGIIQPSNSQWAANIRMAKKKDGKWRMCIDYRDLNKRTVITDPYPLPRIDSLLDTLGRGKVFCALDLISGYHQVPMTRRAQEKSAFITPHMSPSHWEYKYMPFGLTGAPATFQRLVDTMLRGVQYDCVLAYLDDIIVIGEDVSECRRNLAGVLERIRKANLKLKPSKCELFKTEISYLGHIVSANGVATDPKKIRAVQEWAVPLYVTDVRGFLGFCNYYRRFIKDYTSLARPLNGLTCKDSDRVWRAHHTKAFKALKEALTAAPLLALPREGDPFYLDTDASAYGIGGVLSQVQTTDTGIREERPIAYHGRLLLPREMRYCARRRELLAIVEMVQYFRCYLSGVQFTIRTDHDSLKGVKQLDKLTGQMARWIEYLEGFRFTIEVRPGKDHENADFLSRMYTDCFCKEQGSFTVTPSAEEALADEPVTDFKLFEKVCREQADRRVRDKRTEMLRIHDDEALRTLSDHDLREQLVIAAKLAPEPPKAYVRMFRRVRLNPHQDADADRAGTSGDGVGAGDDDQTVDPNALHQPQMMWTRDEIKHAQAHDDELKPVYDAKTGDGLQPDICNFSFEGIGAKFYIAEWRRLTMVDDLLYRTWESGDGDTTWFQLVVPKIYQADVIGAVHSTPVGSHQGGRRTWEFIRRRFFWFEMGKHIRDYVRLCEQCQRRKNTNINPKWPMTVFGVGFPNERVTLDLCGPIKCASNPYSHILIICDVFTKYVVAVPLRSIDAMAVAEAFLDRWCHVFGYPYHIHSDQGGNLTGQLWRELCRHLRIEQTRTTPYRPQANGQNERTNRTIIELLRTTQATHDDWYKRIGSTCFAYNSTPHATTNFAPFYLMFGCEPITDIDARLPPGYRAHAKPTNVHARQLLERLETAHATARRHLRQAAESRKRYYDRDIDTGRHTRRRYYREGERVLMRLSDHHYYFGKFNDRFSGPFYVITVLNNGLLRIKYDEGSPPRIVHHDKLRRFDDGQRHPVPAWVDASIRAFRNRPGTLRRQRNDDDDDDNNDDADDGGQQNAGNLSIRDVITHRCNRCNAETVDDTGILRTTNRDGVCQTCVLDLRSDDESAVDLSGIDWLD